MNYTKEFAGMNSNDHSYTGNILIVSAVFPPEPVVSAKLSYDIAMRLHSMGHKVVVVSPKPTRPLNYIFPANYPSYPFDHFVLDSFTCPESRIIGRTKESISFGKAVNKFINEYPEKIDCIYANTWALFSQKTLAKIASKKNIPLILHEQDVYPESFCSKMPGFVGKMLYRILIPIDKYIQNKATRLIGISPSMIEYLSASRSVEKSKYILARNWQDDQIFIDAYKPLAGRDDNAFNVMYLGSINPTANVSLILRSLVGTNSKHIRMFVVGNGPEKENCQRLAQEVNLDVTFDSVIPELVPIKQSEADALVLCLKKGVAKTATPSKLTAYMLSGRPIIASVDMDSDCADIIRNAHCGIVVPPDDKEALSNAISSMANKDKAELKEMGENSFHYAIDHLSKEKNLQIIIDEIIKISNSLN